MEVALFKGEFRGGRSVEECDFHYHGLSRDSIS